MQLGTIVIRPSLAVCLLALSAVTVRGKDSPTFQTPAQGESGTLANPAVPSADTIARYVRDLGSPSFAQREQAGHKLIEMGVAARGALTAASNDADAEVRVRARAILATVAEVDFRNRLEAFSADYEGIHKKTLPGWERFSAMFGDGAVTRQLFVEMQRSESELLAALVKDDKEASTALDERCRAIMQQAVQAPPDGRITLGTIASLLLVGSAEGVTLDEQLSGQLYSWMIWQPMFQKNAREGSRAPILKKLLGLWVLKDASPTASNENLKFAAMFDLKSEGLALASRLLADEDALPTTKASSLLIVGKFGGKEQMAIAEKLLDDKASCGNVQVPNLPDPPRRMQLQVRDVALAIAVRLSGQSLRDYGYLHVQPHPTTLYQVGTLTFASVGVRDAALQKWSRWRAEHPDS